MVSLERSKKKVWLRKKAMVHFCLCFVMGFFSGFVPTGRTLLFSGHDHAASNISMAMSLKDSNVSKRLMAETPVVTSTSSEDEEEEEEEDKLTPRRLIILVTPASSKVQFQTVLFTRLANTIKLVPQPLLWVVVEGQTGSDEVSEILRRTGIMHRHLVSKVNFTDVQSELNHRRNVALQHIEHHRLNGNVHFAELNTVYDLDFFNQLRDVKEVGTWPLALVAANTKNVVIGGSVCDSSQVIGWHLRSDNDETDEPPAIHISSFAFNSSILWDPERWGRTTVSQDYIQFIKHFLMTKQS